MAYCAHGHARTRVGTSARCYHVCGWHVSSGRTGLCRACGVTTCHDAGPLLYARPMSVYSRHVSVSLSRFQFHSFRPFARAAHTAQVTHSER
eukprot:4220993-Prymnesium_polylepis.1